MAVSENVSSRIFDFVIYALIVIMCVCMIYPFLYIISYSLSDSAYRTNVTFYPIHPNFLLYTYIFHLPTIIRGYFNSVLYTVVGTLIGLVLTVLCAYPLSKPWLPGRQAVLFFVLITMFVSGGLIPTYILVKMLGMMDTMWALILPGAMSTFLMFVALAFFKTIPLELEESSYIDGAGDVTILTRIYLPLAKPILATLSLFYAVAIWNSWFAAAIYLDDSTMYPIQLILRNMMIGMGIQNEEMSAVAAQLHTALGDPTALNYALTVAVILPILIVYPFVQKYFIKGAMIGSLKG